MSQNRKNGKFKYYDEYGQPVDEYGRPVDQYGRAYADYDKNGNPPTDRKASGAPRPAGSEGARRVSAPRGSARSSSSRAVSRSSSARKTSSRQPAQRTDERQTTQREERQTPKRRRRIPIIPIIAIVLAAILALTIWDINHLLGLYQYDDTQESSLSANTQDGIMTMALFGVDTREQGDAGTRSDAIMIMSVDPKRGAIKMVSLMRDSYVNVPGYGQTKLCHAYGYGGPQLAMQTINETFDMNITEYMTVDFAQMASIIDAVGGVTVTLTDDELAETNKYIAEFCNENGLENDPIEKSGEQELNGVQAMTYGRIRKGNTGGDWSRTERQSIVLNAVFAKASSNPVSLLRFLHGLMPNITSSMSKSDFWYMGLRTVIRGMPSMEHIRLPLDGEWEYGSTSSGMSVVKFSDDVLAQHLKDYIYDDVAPTAKTQ